MRMPNHLVLHRLCVCFAATLLSTVCAASAGTSSTNAIEKIGNNVVASNRLQTVTQLLGIIENNDSSQQAKVEAVHALGEMRAEESVPILLSNLALGAGPVVLRGPHPFKKAFPVKDALEKIGEPAVPFILSEIRRTDDPQKLWQLIFSLSSIVGNQETRELITSLAKEDGISRGTHDALLKWSERLRASNPEANSSE